MKRRKFLKAAAFAGLALSSPFPTMSLQAQSLDGPYTGTFWVSINAGGGWDPTLLCDPKGRVNEDQTDPVNMFFADEIGSVGDLRYAPVGGNADFFGRWGSDLLIINGLDTSTNGHDSGSRNVWSGSLNEGQPSFLALAAANAAPHAPMSYISNGGYDFTGGVVARTRSGNTDALVRLAYPNQRNPTSDTPELFHTDATKERIAAAQSARLNRQRENQHLPRIKRSMDMLHTARLGRNEIGKLTEYLPEDLDNSNNRLKRQAQIAIAAYKAGISSGVNLSTGGFDTHGNHDASHVPRLQALLEGADFLIQEAERQGVADKIVVMIGSDFGRTPRYNDGGGKDHWSISSMMLYGPGQGIKGGRVVGATTDGFTPKTVNPDTLAVLEADDDSGVRISPAHVHRALRDLAGINDELERSYPLLVAKPLKNLFG